MKQVYLAYENTKMVPIMVPEDTELKFPIVDVEVSSDFAYPVYDYKLGKVIEGEATMQAKLIADLQAQLAAQKEVGKSTDIKVDTVAETVAGLTEYIANTTSTESEVKA